VRNPYSYRVALIKTIGKELLKYMGVQEVRWNMGATEPQANIYFSAEKRRRIMN
jgi:hypothetical protein